MRNAPKGYVLTRPPVSFKWSFAGGGQGVMALANGKVYTPCDVTFVCAVNATTGALLWQYNVTAMRSTTATIAGGIVYIGGAGGTAMLDAANGVGLKGIGSRWR